MWEAITSRDFLLNLGTGKREAHRRAHEERARFVRDLANRLLSLWRKQAQDYADQETFTHGSSEQRVRWFKRGLEAGKTQACDTFNTTAL